MDITTLRELENDAATQKSFISFQNEESSTISCRYAVEESGLLIPLVSAFFFFTTGIPSNIIVLYIHLKEKQSYANDFYIIMLAVIDLFSLVVLLPQILMLPYIACLGVDGVLAWSYNTLTFFILGSYLL